MLYLTWYMVYMYVILATIGQRDELLTQCQHRCLISFCIKNDLFLAYLVLCAFRVSDFYEIFSKVELLRWTRGKKEVEPNIAYCAAI